MHKPSIIILCLALSAHALSQSLIFSPETEPVEVASSSFGNKAIRMVTNGADEPVLAFGSNGHLYVSVWDNPNNAFGAPMEIDADADVFMSDAEGPRMASQGNYIALTYQISGEWANGARSVHSLDGGLTWSSLLDLSTMSKVQICDCPRPVKCNNVSLEYERLI